MAGKRRNTPARATGRTDRQPAPAINFNGKPPMICTLGADIAESRRLQVALEVIKGRACWLTDPQGMNEPLTV